MKLFVQKMVVFLTMPLFYPAYWIWLFVIRGYRFDELKLIRSQFKSISRREQGPLIICSNHLTFIDSILLMFALGSFWQYFFRFYSLPWNFPKTDHLNFLSRCLCYVGKCIFIDLNHSVEKLKQPMKKALLLLSSGEYIMIFPEGHRSKTGYIDNVDFTYGVGRLICELPNSRVLCIYLRGNSQNASSIFPKKGDHFYSHLNLIEPKIQGNGLHAVREASRTIIKTLSEMEQEYFSQQA